MSEMDPRPAWYTDAACIGMDSALFFPQSGESTRTAKQICKSCVVREECLEYALACPAEKFGIWGGTSERERRRLRHDRSMARRAS